MTRATLVLAAHSFRRVRLMVAAIGLVLAGFQFLLTQVAVLLLRTDAFATLSALVPDFVRSIAGPSTLSFMSFTGIVALGYFHPIVLAALIGLAMAIATEPAAEVESRFADLALTRPLARHEVITRTAIVLVIAQAAVLALMAAGTWTGLTCCTPPTAPRPSSGVIRSLAISLGAIVWCWGGLALAAASAVRRRAVAIGVAGVTALATYLVDYLGRVWEPASRASRLSPFHYFEPMSLVSGEPLNGRHIVVLIAIGLAGTIASYIIFTRRDL